LIGCTPQKLAVSLWIGLARHANPTRLWAFSVMTLQKTNKSRIWIISFWILGLVALNKSYVTRKISPVIYLKTPRLFLFPCLSATPGRNGSKLIHVSATEIPCKQTEHSPKMKIKHTWYTKPLQLHRPQPKGKPRQLFRATMGGASEIGFDVRTSGNLAKKIQNGMNFNH